MKPLVDEDYYLLNKHRLLRSRNRQSPYYLKKLQLYNLEQQQEQLEKAKLKLPISSKQQEMNNFGIGKVRLTPVYFPCELMNDSLRKVSLIRKEKIEKRKKKKKRFDLVVKSKDLLKEFGLTESVIEGKEAAKEEEKEEEEKEREEQDEEQEVDVVVEEDIADYDFTDDYQYTHVDDDDDMGDEDTLNAMGAGDEGPLL